MTKSIFVSVPSVQDKEIFNLSEQIFDEADNPDSIYLGICHSVPFKSKKNINEITKKISGKNISQEFINFYRKMGVGHGRKFAMSLYSGQDYVLQIDAHTNFLKSWDSQILDMYHSVPHKMQGDKYILTAYLGGYQIIEDNKRISPDEYIPRYSCFLSKNNMGKNQGLDETDMDRESDYPSIPRWLTLRPISEPTDNDQPLVSGPNNDVKNFLPEGYIYSRKINANFSFSDKRMAEDYDKIYCLDFLFLEEEFISSIQAFNLGYNLIFPNFPLPLAHLYVDWYNEFYDENARQPADPDSERMYEAQKRVSEYLTDPSNEEKIKKYCEYAGLTYPEFESIDTFYIPGDSND